MRKFVGLGQVHSNHLYWCAASSNGDGELVLKKWLSILNHVTDVHDGHGELFPSCEHGYLADRDWIRRGKGMINIKQYCLYPRLDFFLGLTV